MIATIAGIMLLKTKLFSESGDALPRCAAIAREPKNGPDVILVAGKEQAQLIQKAGDMLSVQGVMARLVVISDEKAFDRLKDNRKEQFLPKGKPVVRVSSGETTPGDITRSALETTRN
jgi:transketolase